MKSPKLKRSTTVVIFEGVTMKKFLFGLVLSVLALASSIKNADAAFSVTLSGAGLSPSTSAPPTTLSNAGTFLITANVAGTGTVVFQGSVIQSTGNALILGATTLSRSGGTAGPLTVTATIRSETISYIDGTATLQQNAGGTFGSVPVTYTTTTGNLPNTPLATLSGTAGTISFSSGPSVPRFIERTFVVTGLVDDTGFAVASTANSISRVTVTTPVPPTALAALVGLPLMAFGRRLRRNNVTA
jgi:hypothetical protein